MSDLTLQQPVSYPAPRLALGIDIGGTKVAAAVVSTDGTVVAQARGATAPESNEAGLSSIFAVADEALAAAGERRREVIGIGAGSPGSIDWQAGVLRGAANLDWHDFPIAAALRERYGLPAVLDNDVNVAAWGERCFAHRIENGIAGAPLEHLVFLAVGTGIGAGIVESGRMVRGQRSAGEIGHIPLFADGPRCRCGMVGCLEGMVSGPAFAAAGRAAAAAGEAPQLLVLAGGDAQAVTPPLIIQAAVAGDAGARAVLDEEAYYLALAVLIAARMLDPEVVVIGGGVAEAGAPLFEALWAQLARIRPSGPDPRQFAVPASLGAHAGALGGAALILYPEPGFREAQSRLAAAR